MQLAVAHSPDQSERERRGEGDVRDAGSVRDGKPVSVWVVNIDSK